MRSSKEAPCLNEAELFLVALAPSLITSRFRHLMISRTGAMPVLLGSSMARSATMLRCSVSSTRMALEHSFASMKPISGGAAPTISGASVLYAWQDDDVGWSADLPASTFNSRPDIARQVSALLALRRLDIFRPSIGHGPDFARLSEMIQMPRICQECCGCPGFGT